MSFTLQVEFSGLCLFVVDPYDSRVAVLMPDARGRSADPAHVDGTDGVPHVGYLRFNLADIVAGFPAGPADEPQFECVHLLNGQELSFGAAPAAPVAVTRLALPELAKIAPHPYDPAWSFLTLDTVALFSGAPPQTLLMRTRLPGGTLDSLPDERWVFPPTLSPGTPYEADFASFVTWTTDIADEYVTIRLAGFDGSHPVAISLRPADGSTVSLKVVNFCDKNPMEWQDLGKRQVDMDDEDFKWIYRLPQPITGTYANFLQGAELPIPKRPPTFATGVEDCLGAQTRQSIPL